jgi:hypothetical protein
MVDVAGKYEEQVGEPVQVRRHFIADRFGTAQRGNSPLGTSARSPRHVQGRSLNRPSWVNEVLQLREQFVNVI